MAELTIGRAEENDLVLPQGGVSRRHARFFLKNGQVVVEDNGSANGTFVDGERISGPTPLAPRAQVVIGDYELSVKAAGAPQARSSRPAGNGASMPTGKPSTTSVQPSVKAARSTRMVPAASKDMSALAKVERQPRSPRPAASSEAGPSFRGLTGPWLNKVYPLKRGAVIGRVPGTAVHIEDDSVSRRHAEVELGPSGVVLRDLGSANGTLVNGEPVAGDMVLTSGDIVQFGVVEMEFDAGETAGRVPGRRREVGGSQAAGNSKGTRLSLIAFGVLGLVLVGWGLKYVLSSQPGPARPIDKPIELDPGAQLTEFLSECRSYSSVELGNPDWARAEAACNKALDIDPIHEEANQLLRKIHIEKECDDYFSRGDKAMSRSREEEALELFAKIRPDCSYYFKAKPKLKEAIEEVRKKTGEDCKRYVSNRQWEIALPRCELHLKIACQRMSDEELYPPLGSTLVIEPRALSRTEWRPKDAMYLRFLQTRARVDPNAPGWRCPHLPIFRDDEQVRDPLIDVKEAMGKRFEDKEIAAAMVSYYQGKSGDSLNLLARVIEKQEKAQVHAQAKKLMGEINDVDSLFKEGQSALQAEDPERAAEPFREALDKDKELMADQFEKSPSFYRRTIQSDMAAVAYRKGRMFGDRGNRRGACRLWKLGFAFFKGNADLLRVLGNGCSNAAVTTFNNANTCEDLAKVLDFAVDGDGMKEKAEAKKAEWQCP